MPKKFTKASEKSKKLAINPVVGVIPCKEKK